MGCGASSEAPASHPGAKASVETADASPKQQAAAAGKAAAAGAGPAPFQGLLEQDKVQTNTQKAPDQQEANEFPASNGPLQPSAVAFVKRLDRMLKNKAERLDGMFSQFDADKGYLTKEELTEFLDFFVENALPGDISQVTALFMSTAASNGQLTLVALTSAATAAAVRKPSAASAPQERAAASGSKPSDASSAPTSAAAAGQLDSGAVSVFRRLDRLLKKSSERLGGMLSLFDVEDKGYITETGAAEFIEFYVENVSKRDAATVAAHLVAGTSNGQLTAELLASITASVAEGSVSRKPSASLTDAAPATPMSPIAPIDEEAAEDVQLEAPEPADGADGSVAAASADEAAAVTEPDTAADDELAAAAAFSAMSEAEAAAEAAQRSAQRSVALAE